MAATNLQVVKDPSLINIPPQDIDAEKALICAILLDNGMLLDIVEILSPEDFYATAHQKIFAAITELFSEGEPVDVITLSNKLKKNKDLQASGGAAYLAELVENIPRAVNAPYYAKIIHDKACLRLLINRSYTIINRCFEEGGDVDGIVDYAQNAVFEISKHKTRQAFHPLGKIIDDSIDIIEERRGRQSLITGVSTGFIDLDRLLLGLQKSDLVILAARPSMGKTSLALCMAQNAAVKSNLPVAIFSLEMSKEQLAMRLLCSEAKVDSSRVRGGSLSKDDWDRLTDAASVLSNAPIFIDDSADISAMEIRAKSRRLKMEHDVGLIVIDYLQLMKSHHQVERRDLEISEISRSMKALAKELDVPVLALSQLNRKVEERIDKRPQLADLRESGSLEQDADVVAFIYRDEVYNRDENNPNKGKAEVIIGKQRNGPIGVVTLAFINNYTRFENLA